MKHYKRVNSATECKPLVNKANRLVSQEIDKCYRKSHKADRGVIYYNYVYNCYLNLNAIENPLDRTTSRCMDKMNKNRF